MDPWTLVLGGGGLVGLAAFVLTALRARRDVMSEELLQWRVEATGRTDRSVSVSVAPVGGAVRDVALMIGVPQQRFDTSNRLGFAEWPLGQGVVLTTNIPRLEQERLFVFVTFRSAQSPKWTHETWVPVFDEGPVWDLHVRLTATSAGVKLWRWLVQAPALPVEHGLTYRRSSPARRNRQLRRAMKAGVAIPDPKSQRQRCREQRRQTGSR